jgi:group I intron endonuclease
MSARILSGIYLIRNTVDGRVYVGSTVNIPRRWRLHRLYLNKGSHHCPPLQGAWIKHGESAFVFDIIEAVEPTKAVLASREQLHLDNAFASTLVYNVSSKAGSPPGPLGLKRSEAYLAKKRGKRRSATARANISAGLLGKKRGPQSAAHRAAISAGNMGRKVSAETGAKISLAKKGKPLHANTREAARLANTGRKHTPEHIEKATGWKKGSKDPPETRERKRLAAVKREGRLTDADVLAIRASGEAGAVLAKRYGVSYYTIWDIRKRRSWTHI